MKYRGVTYVSHLLQKSPLLAFIKFESRFLTGSLAVCLSAPVQGEAGGRGVWGRGAGGRCGECVAPPPPQPVLFGYFQTDTAKFLSKNRLSQGGFATRALYKRGNV